MTGYKQNEKKMPPVSFSLSNIHMYVDSYLAQSSVWWPLHSGQHVCGCAQQCLYKNLAPPWDGLTLRKCYKSSDHPSRWTLLPERCLCWDTRRFCPHTFVSASIHMPGQHKTVNSRLAASRACLEKMMRLKLRIKGCDAQETDMFG